MTTPARASIVVATGNPHKVIEIREILGEVGIEVLSLNEVASGDLAEPQEDGSTFAENARLKAVGYARAIGRTVLADDSGLSVDALGGNPGIHSARWAGVGGTRAERDAANNAKLQRELAARPSASRGARFICAMCLAAADGSVIAETVGEFVGVIADSPRGANGFGYDPYFVVDASGRTSAELSPSEKNARSHRGCAARAMAGFLARLRAEPDAS
ncbi:MAG: RdgB/HAM1 family non-canonical purine NTP pyrophosphatase [Phycisphaerales bacterium]|nr:RdgB/HAM1 family non-canonical purine NTP pyrophosphatase [Phycisphaerales bacterium]